MEDLRGAGDSAWQRTAAQSSPELRISSLDADMADIRHRLAKSDLLPKISVVAHESFTGPITFEVPPIDRNLNIRYVGLGVRYDLGALYKSSRKIRQADVQARQARQSLRLAEENLRNNVYQAYIDYCQSYAELLTMEKSLQLASENYERILYRYMEQLALVTDMLDAFNMKLDAELGVADMRAEILYRQCKLKYTAGVL